MIKPDSIAYPPRGMNREEAARYIGVGTTTFDGLVADGRMPKPMRLGKRVIWDRLKIDAAFTELDEGSQENYFDRTSRLNRANRADMSEDIDWARIARGRGDALARGVDPDTGEPLRRRKRVSRSEDGQGDDG